MANWRSFGDRMLYCHRSMLKLWCNCCNSANFHNSSSRRRGGGGLFLGGGGCFEKAAPFSPIRRCSSPPHHHSPVSPRSPLLMVPPGVVVDDKNLRKNSHDNNNNNNNNGNDNNSNSNDYFHFFSLSDQSEIRVRKNLSIPWQRDLLTPDAAPCVGSSHGWLAFNHPRNCHPYLYNPLMDSPDLPYIPLPSIETLPSVCGVRLIKSDHLSPSPSLITRFLILHKSSEHDIPSDYVSYSLVRRLVMSSAPSSVPCCYSSSSSNEDCTIMAIHSESANIAFCKLGDNRWTALDGSLQPYIDIIYFSKDQRFYAMKSNCSIEAWDIRDPSCPKNQVFDNPSFCPGKLEDKFRGSYNCARSNYLVESSGDLLLLSRFIALSVAEYGFTHPRRLEEKVENNINEELENSFLHDDDAYWTLGFDVRKFDFDHNKWEPVECLGDQALFVGSNHSFSLSTRDYPELMGNSIYFTDDDRESNNTYHGHDNGVFHLGDNSIKPYYPSRLKIIDPHPVWVAPNTM